MLLKSLPNLVTTMRLFLTPLVVWLLLEDELTWAFWVFVLAGVLDGVDGFLARVLDARTKLGALLDPLADKVLVGAAYVTMGVAGLLPVWLVVMVVFRDLLIVAAVGVMRYTDGAPAEIKPLFISKVNTAVQITLVAAVLAKPALGIPEFGFTPLLIWVAAATTVASAAAYVYVWVRRMMSPNP